MVYIDPFTVVPVYDGRAESTLGTDNANNVRPLPI